MFHYFFQIALLAQGVYCFHTKKHTIYQFTEEESDKSSDEVGTALFDWICNAKLGEGRPFTELHIWMDNSSAQNKNFYIVCLLLFVVQIGLLEKIYLEFLVSKLCRHLLINEIVLIICL